MSTSDAHDSTRRYESHPPRHLHPQRREKAKSSQSCADGGVRPNNNSNHAAGTADGHGHGLEHGIGDSAAGTAARPGLKPRQNSAPLLYQSESPSFVASPAAQHHAQVTDGQDEDEIAGIVGAVRQTFQHPELSEPFPEINIAVIGAERVGKTTFCQRALGLPEPPPWQAAERRIPIQGNEYLVRLLELPIEDIEIDDDETINWPDCIEDKMLRVDGALALYSVQDKASVVELPEMLNVITKASLPALLVSCKCDTPPSERQLNPTAVEESAKRAIGQLNTYQVSESDTVSNKRGLLLLLNDIVERNSANFARSSSARRRAQSTAVRPVSPRHIAHSRASSEFSMLKDQRHTRHDSSIAGHGDRLRVPRGDDPPMHGSFLFEESASEQSRNSSRSSLDVDVQSLAGALPPSTNVPESGATFDELVDRLLVQPTSKADLKFARTFLSLYRKFAAPGKLLEAIVERFDDLDQSGIPQIMKTQTQLRYVSVLEQWVGSYPGDFAYPRTKRRLQTFVAKLAELRIFAQAAKEINIDLEAVQEDDDTNWAYCDRDREASGQHLRDSMSSTASTLLDDPTFTFGSKDLSGSTLNDEATHDFLPSATNQMLANVRQSQQQAHLLQAIPRNPVTKTQWRILMDQPDELIAMELTRIDWILFTSIRPRDLVRHVSLSKGEKAAYKNLPYVDRLVEHFNQLACWVANYVLLRDKPKHRALMLEKFMRIARKVRELNNYNSFGAIIAGVKSTAVHRLGATRELLPQAVGKDWMKLEILMSPTRSHFAYRLAWENSSSERIPYLPLHRRDLTTAEEGNKTFIGDDGENRINWKKFEIMGDVVVSLQRAQALPYTNLGGTKGSEQIRELVLDVKLVKDEEELYERSLQCEPAANSSQGQGGGGSSASKFRDFFKRGSDETQFRAMFFGA